MAFPFEIAIQTTAIAAGFGLVWNQQRVLAKEIEIFRSEEKSAHKLLNEKLDLALDLTEELVNDRRERVANDRRERVAKDRRERVAKEAEAKARAEKKSAEEKAQLD